MTLLPTARLLPLVLLLPLAAALLTAGEAAAAEADTAGAPTLQARADSGTAALLQEQQPLRIELTQATVAPAASAGQGIAALQPGTAGAGFETATQTMAWIGGRRAAFGVGVEQPWRAPAASLVPQANETRDARLLLGVTLATSSRTRLSWHSEPFGTRRSAEGGAGPAAGTANEGAPTAEAPVLALDMRRSDPYRAMLRGSLRMQLGRDTAITLKPRGRRIGVALTSQW